MNKFIKDNFVLLCGITLPIIMILVLWIATVIPQFFVAQPQYDLLFATNSYGYYDYFIFTVKDGKLLAALRCNEQCINRYNFLKPNLYLFQIKSRTIQEIKIDLPALKPDAKTMNAEIKIPETENWQISSNQTAPDGYTFSAKSYNSMGLMTDLLFNPSSSPPRISKNGYTIPIKIELDYPNNYGFQFIGWVIHK